MRISFWENPCLHLPGPSVLPVRRALPVCSAQSLCGEQQNKKRLAGRHSWGDRSRGRLAAGEGTAQQGRWHRTPVGSPSPLGSTRYGENNKITFFVYKVGDS